MFGYNNNVYECIVRCMIDVMLFYNVLFVVICCVFIYLDVLINNFKMLIEIEYIYNIIMYD